MSYTSSGTPIHLVCSVCGKSLQGAFYQIGERYLCPQCIGVSQAFQPAVFNPSVPMPDYSSDWLAENIRLRSENEALKAQFAELEAINARQAETIAMLKRAAPNLFDRVMQASEEYVIRFGGTLNLSGAKRKVEEEYDEFMKATKNYISRAGLDDELEMEAAKEAIDLLVTVGGYLRAANVRYAWVNAAAHDTLKKLTDRTDADYAWDEATKTVMKKSKMVQS